MPRVSQLELISGALTGQVISFPTDTVPALAIHPAYASLLFALKGRPPEKPLILMAASVDILFSYTEGTPEELQQWRQVARKYWPGPLTMVLPASSLVPLAMNPTRSKTIGLRLPDCAIAQEILTKTGPLATTSANYSGSSPLETMGEINQAFPAVLTLTRDDLPLDVKIGDGQPSTVVQWTGTEWAILRPGSIKAIEA